MQHRNGLPPTSALRDSTLPTLHATALPQPTRLGNSTRDRLLAAGKTPVRPNLLSAALISP